MQLIGSLWQVGTESSCWKYIQYNFQTIHFLLVSCTFFSCLSRAGTKLACLGINYHRWVNCIANYLTAQSYHWTALLELTYQQCSLTYGIAKWFWCWLACYWATARMYEQWQAAPALHQQSSWVPQQMLVSGGGELWVGRGRNRAFWKRNQWVCWGKEGVDPAPLIPTFENLLTPFCSLDICYQSGSLRANMEISSNVCYLPPVCLQVSTPSPPPQHTACTCGSG